MAPKLVHQSAGVETINYKNLLQQYCGRRIEELLRRWGDKRDGIVADKQTLVIFSMRVEIPAEMDPHMILGTMVRYFDLLYKYTEGTERGHLITFSLNSALGYFLPEESHWTAISELNKELTENSFYASMNASISLHSGQTVLGNWGSSRRFILALLGPSVQIAEAISQVGIKTKDSVLFSDEYRDAHLSGHPVSEVTRVGVVGNPEQTKVFRPIDL